MEKFGLFDLIDKFNAASSGKNDFSESKKTEAAPQKPAKTTDSVLKDPDFTAQPQYMMNAKMTAYMKRHEKLLAEIKSKNDVGREKK